MNALFFDAHNHLQDERLTADREGVLERAAAAGVARLACNGTHPGDWAAVQALADRLPGLAPCYGVHPWRLAGRPADWLDQLAARLADPRARVGEIGLDHALEPRDDTDMAAVFLAQLQLSIDLRRAATLHCRRAWGRLLELLAPLGPHPAGLVLHAYSGGPDLVEPLVRLNAFFSFSGSLTFSSNKRGRRAAAAVPADRLLIESDAPDMPPPDWPRDRPNEPANCVRVAETLAELRGATLDDIARQTFANAERLFGCSS